MQTKMPRGFLRSCGRRSVMDLPIPFALCVLLFTFVATIIATANGLYYIACLVKGTLYEKPWWHNN